MQTQLKLKIASAGHGLCIGFDPDTSDLHPFLARQRDKLAPESFLERWYDATVTKIALKAHSIKFQSAFFEQFGPTGMTALRDVMIDAKRRGLFVILDAKRGDISSTMTAYGNAAFDAYQADALTILPWMGTDSLKALIPWLKRGRSVYVVWLSSNTSGRQLQMLNSADGEPLALKVFCDFYRLAETENVTRQVGWVLGATSIPLDLVAKLPGGEHAFLLPGIGAQGADFDEKTSKLTKDHPASLYPVSRGILKPQPTDELHSWEDYSTFVEARWSSLVKRSQTQTS